MCFLKNIKIKISLSYIIHKQFTLQHLCMLPSQHIKRSSPFTLSSLICTALTCLQRKLNRRTSGHCPGAFIIIIIIKYRWLQCCIHQIRLNWELLLKYQEMQKQQCYKLMKLHYPNKEAVATILPNPIRLTYDLCWYYLRMQWTSQCCIHQIRLNWELLLKYQEMQKQQC